MLLNAAIAASGRRVDFLHLPTLGTPDDAFFAPLERLRAPDAKVYLGAIHLCTMPTACAVSCKRRGGISRNSVSPRRAASVARRSGRAACYGGRQCTAARYPRHHRARPPQRSRAAP
jgi:hypothetical protein